jgi:hypothetical protein
MESGFSPFGFFFADLTASENPPVVIFDPINLFRQASRFAGSKISGFFNFPQGTLN